MSATLDFKQRQRANILIESGIPEETAFEIIALRDFVQYVRDFYQANFDVMPVAFQTVDNEAAVLLGQSE